MVIHEMGLSFSVMNDYDVKVLGFYPRREEKTRLAIPPHVQGYRVAVIGKKAFYDCTKLRHVILPPSVHTIEDEAFGLCASLEDIVLPDSIKHIGKGVFEDTLALQKVVLPPHLESLSEGLFYGSALHRITMPEHLTEIPSGCFYDCEWLDFVVLPNAMQKIAHDAFHYCYRLEDVAAPPAITHIEKFDGIQEWKLETTSRQSKYKVVQDGNVWYTDDYEMTVKGFGWDISYARENLSTHNFICEIFDNATGKLMHREEYKF